MTLVAARVRGITSSGRVPRNRRRHHSDPLAPAGAGIENGNCLVERWNPASIPVQRRSFRREPTGTGSYSPQESNLIANSSLEPMQRYNAISPECTAIFIHTQVNLSIVQRHPVNICKFQPLRVTLDAQIRVATTTFAADVALKYVARKITVIHRPNRYPDSSAKFREL